MFDNEEYKLLSKVHSECIRAIKAHRKEFQVSLEEVPLDLLYQPFVDLYFQLAETELTFEVDEVIRRHYLSRWNAYRYEADPKNIIKKDFEFPDEGITQSLYVNQLANNKFRVEDLMASFSGKIKYHDVIEVKQSPTGDLIFQKVIEESSWQTNDYLLPRKIIESTQLENDLKDIQKNGGLTEIKMGGWLTIAMPPNSKIDVDEKINALISQENEGKK